MMDLKRKTWYQKFREYLFSLQDVEYKKFHGGLVKTKYEIIGIRMPIQRKIAKEISKGNVKDFLMISKDYYYEEVNIKGLVIANLEDVSDYLDEFVLKIDNWAICDSFCSSLKVVKNNKEKYWTIIENYLQNENEFVGRVGVVLLLNFYVEKDYVLNILNLVDKLKRDEYYVNMAVSWLVAECFIKYPDLTLDYIKKNNLSAFTQNKMISKIRDSYRVDKKIKDMLLLYRK